MLVIPGQPGKDTCDGITRRELLRIGGSTMFGLSLANIFRLQKASAAEANDFEAFKVHLSSDYYFRR